MEPVTDRVEPRRGRNIITISGLPGSGTTTAALLLAGRTGFQHVNTGAIFRQMARERGLSLNDFGKLAAGDDSIDRELDARQVAVAANGNIILEGRLAGHMISRAGLDALTVWLDAPLETRVARVSGRDQLAVEVATELNREREHDERMRYIDFYNIDLQDLSVYGLVLDSSAMEPGEIVQVVLEAL